MILDDLMPDLNDFQPLTYATLFCVAFFDGDPVSVATFPGCIRMTPLFFMKKPGQTYLTGSHIPQLNKTTMSEKKPGSVGWGVGGEFSTLINCIQT